MDNKDFHIIRTKLDELTQSTNITSTLQSAIKHGLVELSERVVKLEQEIHTLPMIASTTAFIMARLADKGALLKKFRRDILERDIDLDVLRELLDTDWPFNVEEGSVRLTSMTRLSQNHLGMTFVANTKSRGVGIFEVDAFDHWVNVSTSPTLVKYTGSKYLIANRTSNCVRAIMPEEKNVIATCKTENFRDQQLDAWTAMTQTQSLENINRTQVKQAWPNLAIYCFPDEIAIDGNRPISCPNFPFELPTNSSWYTSDYHFNTTAAQFVVDDSQTSIKPLVKQTKTDYPHDEPIKALKLITKLNKELEEMRNSTQNGGLHTNWLTTDLLNADKLSMASILSWALFLGLCLIAICAGGLCTCCVTASLAMMKSMTRSNEGRELQTAKRAKNIDDKSATSNASDSETANETLSDIRRKFKLSI